MVEREAPLAVVGSRLLGSGVVVAVVGGIVLLLVQASFAIAIIRGAEFLALEDIVDALEVLELAFGLFVLE